MVKRVFTQIVNDQIAERLKSALKKETEAEEKSAAIAPTEPDALIVTTEEEIEGYLIIKSILRKEIEVGRIFMRDNQSYCGILLDDNNRKPICHSILRPIACVSGCLTKTKRRLNMI